jgi:hypothetical protein
MAASSSKLPESGRHTPPPALAAKSYPTRSSPIGHVPPYFVQHKRDQVQAFDDSIALEPLPLEDFLRCLLFNVSETLPSKIPSSLRGLFSIDCFVDLANGIAKTIKAKREYHLLCINLFLTTHDFH